MFFHTHGRRIVASLIAAAFLAPQCSAAANAAAEPEPAPAILGAALPQAYVFTAPVEALLAEVGPVSPPGRMSSAVQQPLLPRPTNPPRPMFKLPPGHPKAAFKPPSAAARLSSAHAAAGPRVSSIRDLPQAPRDQRTIVARFLKQLGAPAAPGAGRTISPAQPGRYASRPGASSGRRASTVDVNALNVTGLKPWWQFESGVIPGVGTWLVNDFWQNLVVRVQDMEIPYRGVDFSFRRTYNSYSGHDYEDTNGASEIGQFGAGWTNTFDAHMSLNNCVSSGYNYYGTGFNGFSIYDVDGARYDYCFDANGTLQPPPGMEGTTLKTIDGGSFFWTTKDGTTYDFYAPYYPPSMAAYNGRLYRIWGRNSNNALQFSYGWDATAAAPSGDSSSSAYLRHMWVTTDSGLQAHLYFDDFSGRRLCSTLTFPDNATSVSYAYDAAGQLWYTVKPGNNAVGTKYEGYVNYHTNSMVIAGPRYMGSWNGTVSTDGSFVWFTEGGNGNAQVSSVSTAAYINFTPDDGTNTLLQPSSPQLTGLQTLRTASFGINPGYTTSSDTDGHQEIQYVDGFGRPTEHDWYTGSQTLKTYRTWDAHNNPVYDIDAANHRTDYSYDANSNLSVVAFPSVDTSQGTFRPTKLMDHDANNNLTAYCDETAVHASGHDYPNVQTGSASQCVSLAGNQPHVQLNYTATSAEPYGELTSMVTPRGYTWHYGYTTGYEGGGVDYGLATEVQGDQVSDYDGVARTPVVRRIYDAHGRLGCSVSDANDAHTVQVVIHDTLGRVTAMSDADDASLQPTVNCAKSSTLGAGAAMVTRATYYPDSSIATTQTPDEALAGVSTSFAYDMEGNLKSEVRHRSGQTATTRKWYDGANRLVEVELPQQLAPNRSTTGGDYAYSLPDFYGSTWLTRYWYGLSGTNNPPGMNGPAYGGLYQIAEYTRAALNNTAMSWVPTRGFVYDALDRTTAYTHYADNYTQLGLNASEVYQYDAVGQGGMLSTKTKAGSTEYEYFNYDALGRVLVDGFMDTGGGQVTPGHSYAYDANGRIAREQSTGPGAGFGAVQFAYDADGNLTSKADVGGTYNDAPSTISYGYYPDGMRANVSVTAQGSGGFTQQNLFRYAYRPDGLVRRESVQVPPSVSTAFSSGDFTWTYTGAGRMTMRTDPLTNSPISGLYGSSAHRAVQGAVQPSVSRGTSQPVAAEVAAKIVASQQRSMRSVSAHEPKHRAIVARRGGQEVRGTQPMVVQGPCPLSATRSVQSTGVRSTSVVQSCCNPDNCPDPTPPPDPTPGPPTPTPAPTATPQPAKTFAPIAVGYDNTGRVNSYQIPSGGQYTNFHYGSEGDLTDYSGFGDAAHAQVHVVDAYNVRGELTGEHFFNNTGSTGAYDHTWPNSDLQPANGAMLPANTGNQTSFNTRSAEITFNQTVSTFNANNGALCQQPISQMQWTSDGSGRHVAGFAYELAFRPPDCNTADGVGGHLARTYDTADHLVQWSLPTNDYWPGLGQFLYCQTAPFPDGTPAYVRSATGTINYGWGPENLLVQRHTSGGTTTNIHWDGSTMLFTTDGAGHVTNLKIGSDADILPNAELLVRDRDWTGQVVMSHDPTGYSPWQPPNPYHDACTPNNAPTYSPNFDGPRIADATFTQLASDGYSDGYNTFQGARTFDPKMGQWTTQDAVIGSTNDPMSMKAYTWNRGNPRQFGDPDGRQAIPYTVIPIFNVSPQWIPAGSWLLGAIVRGLAIGRTALMGPIGGIGLALMPISAGEDGAVMRHVLFAANGMSGENSATRLGREMHKNYQPPDDPNCKKDFKIPGTDFEADCYNEETGDLYELKPNTKRQIARGIAQLWRYRQALLKAGRTVRHMYVDTYTPGVPGSYVPTVSPIGTPP